MQKKNLVTLFIILYVYTNTKFEKKYDFFKVFKKGNGCIYLIKNIVQ